MNETKRLIMSAGRRLCESESSPPESHNGEGGGGSARLARGTSVYTMPRGQTLDDSFLSNLLGKNIRRTSIISSSSSYSMVYKCRVTPTPPSTTCTPLVIKVMETEVLSEQRSPAEEIVRVIQTHNIPDVRADAADSEEAIEQVEWLKQVDNFATELRYARFMGRENIGPRVYQCVMLLEQSSLVSGIRKVVALLVMEKLYPTLHCDANLEADMLRLMRRLVNRRMFCFDLKAAHFMRTSAGDLRCIDFGVDWCLRRLPMEETHSLAFRKACLVCMVAHLFMHMVWYSKYHFFGKWLHRHVDSESWELAGRIYAHSELELIPHAYFESSGADAWRRLTHLFQETNVGESQLYTRAVEHGIYGTIQSPKPLSQTHLLKWLAPPYDDD